MVQTKDQKDGEASPKRPLVAFLGPPSSFTHQVREPTLAGPSSIHIDRAHTPYTNTAANTAP